MRTQDATSLAGRVFLAVIFLASAFGKITNFDATTHLMEVHGMPMTALLCAGAAAVEALGGIALVLGFQARWGAAALAAFLIAVTAVFHTGAEPEQRIHLLKNLAILGGLLQIMAFGPGEISLEDRGRAAR